MRAVPEAAQGEANAVFEDFQVRRALSSERVLFHPSPQSLVRVEFGSVGWQTIGPQPGVMLLDRRPGFSRPVRVQPVPEQEDRAGYPAQQVADEADEFGAGDGTPHQMKVSVRVRGNGRDGRQFRPVEAMIENGRLPLRGPGLAGCGQQGEAALVQENHRGVQRAGFFFKRGQVCFTQCWMAASSRSLARRAGFCQLQPKRCNRRQTWSRS